MIGTIDIQPGRVDHPLLDFTLTDPDVRLSRIRLLLRDTRGYADKTCQGRVIRGVGKGKSLRSRLNFSQVIPLF